MPAILANVSLRLGKFWDICNPEQNFWDTGAELFKSHKIGTVPRKSGWVRSVWSRGHHCCISTSDAAMSSDINTLLYVAYLNS
jgi:hypothetical protein